MAALERRKCGHIANYTDGATDWSVVRVQRVCCVGVSFFFLLFVLHNKRKKNGEKYIAVIARVYGSNSRYDRRLISHTRKGTVSRRLQENRVQKSLD